MTTRKCLQRLALAGVVIWVTMLVVAGVRIVSANRLVDKKHRAQEQCLAIATAVEAYMQSPVSWERPYPPTLKDLAHPPGERSYLRNGDADLIDPWGNPFEMQLVKRSDGTAYYLITTTAPDGTSISQHGIGANAVLRE